MDSIGACRVEDRADEGVGVDGKSAIDHQRAFVTGHRDDVGTLTLEERETAEIAGRDIRSGRLRTGRENRQQ
jgi:hypothetical protein